jgi:hypothetical protein
VEESEQEEPKAKVKKDKVATKTRMVQICKCKTLRMWSDASGEGWSCVDCKVNYACDRVDPQRGGRPRVVAPRQRDSGSLEWPSPRLINWRSNLSCWNAKKGARYYNDPSKPAHLDIWQWRSVLAERRRLANLIDTLVRRGCNKAAITNIEKLEVLLGCRDQ